MSVLRVTGSHFCTTLYQEIFLFFSSARTMLTWVCMGLYDSPALFLLAACGFHPLVVPVRRDVG